MRPSDIYENTSGAARCKTIQVVNNCDGDAELMDWYHDSKHHKVYDGDAPPRPIGDGETKAYDVNVADGHGIDLQCGGSNEECCDYTIEGCVAADADAALE